MKLEWKTCFKVGATVFLLYLCFYYWKATTNLVSVFVGAATPLIIGTIIAYLVNILMSFYEKHYFPNSNKMLVLKTKRIVCMFAAIVTLIGIVVFVICLVVPEVGFCFSMLMSEVPRTIEKFMEWLVNSGILAEVIPSDIVARINSINWQEWFSQIVQFITRGLSGMAGAVSTMVSSVMTVFSGIVTALISVIFSIYILMGKDRLKAQCHRFMKNYLPSTCRIRVEYFFGVLNECFHRYIVGQCIEAVILGVLCALGMTLFRFPYAIMIGALVSVTALIPIAGAYIGAGVGAFMMLTISPIKAILFLIFIIVLQQLEGNLIYPRVVGSSLGLPGFWVLAAVTIGGSVAGVGGMLLGVPVTAAIYRLIREDMERKEGREHYLEVQTKIDSDNIMLDNAEENSEKDTLAK